MIWILAIASSLLEMAFAFKVPLWARLAGRFPVLGLVASISLSWFLGKMFGAAGLIALMGGILSTLITVPCYVIVEKWHAGEIQPKIVKFRKDWESLVQLARDVGKVIYILLRIITFPIWAYRDIKQWLAQHNPLMKRSTTSP
jgi:hypothetical protein